MPADSTLTQRYFTQRNAGLAALPERRAAMGEREMATLALLAKLCGTPNLYASLAGETLIDAGCGDRFLENPAHARGLAYTGLDIGEVDFARDRWPVADQSAAGVVSLAVIEHLHDPALFLSEAMRVLKPGGWLWLSTPNFQWDARNFYNDPTHVKPYTPMGMETLLRMSGFAGGRTFPGLRCKPDFYYTGPRRFAKAYWLLPFRGDARFAPSWLKGRATSLFAVARKP